MNVSLPPDLERLVEDQVQSGRYPSIDHMIGEALRLIAERDRLVSLQEPAARQKIAAGMASLRAGLGTDGDEFMALMDAELGSLQQHDR